MSNGGVHTGTSMGSLSLGRVGNELQRVSGEEFIETPVGVRSFADPSAGLPLSSLSLDSPPSESELPRRFSGAGGGDAYWMTYSLILAVLLAMGGCSDTRPTTQKLPISKISNWAMPAAGAKIPAPRGLAFDSNGDLFVLDDAGRVLVFDTAGQLKLDWSMPENEVGNPEGICLFEDGRIGIADTHYHRVVFFDRDGNVLSMHGGHGEATGQFIYLSALTQDSSGNYYVCEYGGNDRVQKFDVDGNFLTAFGTFGTGDGEFQRPMGIVWRDAKIYVADAINNRIQVFTDDGQFVRVLSDEVSQPRLHYPYDLTSGPKGDLFAIEYGGNRVTHLSLQGETLGTFGSTGHGVGEFSTPWGLAVDSTGRIVVADTGNRRLVELQR